MRVEEIDKYQAGDFHVIQLLTGNSCIYLVVKYSKIGPEKLYKESFSRFLEARSLAIELDTKAWREGLNRWRRRRDEKKM